MIFELNFRLLNMDLVTFLLQKNKSQHQQVVIFFINHVDLTSPLFLVIVHFICYVGFYSLIFKRYIHEFRRINI